MRLVIATPLYPPEIGGPATYAEALVRGLPREDIEVEVIKFNDVRHLPKIIRHYMYYRRILAALRTADMVLALDPVSTGLPALRAANKLGKPLVVKIVGDYAWEQGQQRYGITATLDEFAKLKKVPRRVRFLHRLQRRVAQQAVRVIVPSEYLKKIVMGWGITGEKIEVIYNAVPIESLGQVPDAVHRLPHPLIVSAGRLVPWKDMHGVIEAVRMMSKASLAIVGDGPLYSRLVDQMRDDLGVRGVLTGSLPHADLLAVIKNADMFVLNSSYEGLSHLLIEAQALGVPTIATHVGGNPEVIAAGENGVLIASGEPRTLADALIRLLENPEMRARLAARGKELSSRFSEEVMLRRTKELLVSLV